MKRGLLIALSLASTACEQITGIKPTPIDCSGRDTIQAKPDGSFHFAPKLGCLKLKSQ